MLKIMEKYKLLVTLLSTIKDKDNIKCLILKRYLCETYSYFLSTNICDLAAKIGDIPLMIYLHNRGHAWNKWTIAAAAAGGQLECIKYAHEHGCAWDDIATEEAAKRGDLDCLKYLHENGCPWIGTSVTFQVANQGHLECLQYAHENGCAWDREVTETAAYNQHLDCLQYACENGCYWILIDGIPHDFDRISLSMRYYFVDVQDEEILTAERPFDSVELHVQPSNSPNSLVDPRKRYEHLRYKHKEDCEWKNWSLIFAKQKNYKNFLRYAREHKCKCGIDV